MTDAEGNPVLCQEAVAARDALIEKLAALPPVQAALDQILHRFGGEAVAEVKLQTRKWRKDGEDSDRFSTEILLVPGGRVQFLDKPNGNGAPAMNGDTVPSAGTAATVDDNEIPF